MAQFILKAVITGFLLSIMIGPVFFVLLETSIKKGIRAAIAFDLGVLISDCIYIMIAYLFYAEVEDLVEGSNSNLMQIIGGILFLIYGTHTFLKKSTGIKKDADGKLIKDDKDYKMLFLKGFILNMANPMVIFYWFSVMTLAAKTGKEETGSVALLLVIIMTTFFAFDILKIMGAKRLRPLMTNNLLQSLNRLIGIVFVLFGLFLFIKGGLKM
ncbi:MAG: threonine/homoserine/homoserine lactone efflux protein [Lentimonas sp.]